MYNKRAWMFIAWVGVTMGKPHYAPVINLYIQIACVSANRNFQLLMLAWAIYYLAINDGYQATVYMHNLYNKWYQWYDIKHIFLIQPISLMADTGTMQNHSPALEVWVFAPGWLLRQRAVGAEGSLCLTKQSVSSLLNANLCPTISYKH